MTFTTAVRTCLSKYITFSGRAGRSEYWWFVLFIFIVSAVLGFIDNAVFGFDPVTRTTNGWFGSLFSLAIFLPALAAGWRRMHDTGKPGVLLLLPMLVSFATMFFMMLGVLTFAGLENAGADQQALVGIAAFLGVTGMLTLMVVQLVLVILMLWWLTRASDAGDNKYGAPASP